MTEPKSRIITLTDRAPVRITEVIWPLVATGDYRPGSAHNGTPVPNDQTDRYTLRVRAHADGRAIVYGVVDAATAWTGNDDWSGGEIVDPGDDIVAAIRRVGSKFPDRVIRECIADLPAEDIDHTKAATEPYVASLAAGIAWARTAKAGEYLVTYAETGMTDDEDPGSRCGYSDLGLEEIRRVLSHDGLTLTADGRGLVAQAVRS